MTVFTNPFIFNRTRSPCLSISSHRPIPSASKRLPNRTFSPQALSDSLPLYGAATASVSLIGFGAWKAYLYFQLEYITASMISNHVPKGGASVLQIGGGTKLFYYYPKGTIQIAVTQSSTNKGVLENGGLAAKIPVVVRSSVDLDKATQFHLGPSGSYDAVVMLDTFSKIRNRTVFLQEVATVLKPNGVFVFIEKDGSILDRLGEVEAFGEVMNDVALKGQDDRWVGVAKKGETIQKQKSIRTGFASN